MTSKNIFYVNNDIISISHPDWDFSGMATIRDDYKDELMGVTWSDKRGYLSNQKLGGYLHRYIMKKWYGEDRVREMKAEGFVVDHMDNDGYNCCINNLCFLHKDENTAKGLTFDKENRNKTHIALSLYKDFETQLIQITIVFNYPAKAVAYNLNTPAVFELAYLLYDKDYKIVLNDAKSILCEYKKNYSFEPEKLRCGDYYIEGKKGKAYPVELYDKYIAGEFGGSIAYFEKKAPLKNWTLDEKKRHCNIVQLLF